MRFVQILHDGVQKIGLLSKASEGVVLDLSSKLARPTRAGSNPGSMVDFLEDHPGTAAIELATKAIQDGDLPQIRRNQVVLLSPITRPHKLICVGMNYKDHCEEQGVPLPVEPIIFNKFPNCIAGPLDNIPYPSETQELDWEVELAVVIGLEGRLIKREDTMKHVFGYTVAHDVSARDWQLQRNGGQWLLGKTMDKFCPLGPELVTKDEFKDPYNLRLQCRVNGVTKQDGNTKELIHKIEDIIAYISRFATLQPGDVILTGTPPGVGCFKNPPEFLKKGDLVECEIEQIGVLSNEIV